jgi:hypothetical protein
MPAGQQALDERAAGLLTLDHEQRKLGRAVVRSFEHDEQPVDRLVLDDARLAQLHPPHASGEQCVHAASPEPVERRRGLPGERLAGEGGERLEQAGGGWVAASLGDLGKCLGKLGERRLVQEREE